ncbi:T9SS type A sorting domain-containing protein [Tenacibaculum haliotis]
MRKNNIRKPKSKYESINVSRLFVGVYFVKFNVNNGSNIKKLVIK